MVVSWVMCAMVVCVILNKKRLATASVADESNDENKIIFDAVPAWIFYKDKQNRFIRVNNALCLSMGMKKEELEGTSCFDIFPNEQAEAYFMDDKEVFESGKAKGNIIEPIKTVGGQRWVLTNKVPYLNKEGECIGVIGFGLDITDRKVAQEMVKEVDVMLQKIIDLLPIRIFWKDVDLKYLGCNLTLAHDAGMKSVDEVVGKSDFDMGWKNQAELYRKDDFEVIRTGEAKIDYKEEQTTPDGKIIWLNTNKVPLLNSNNEIIGVLGTYDDVTEKKMTEDHLKKSLEESKKLNKFMVDREVRMVDLKKQINSLENSGSSNE